MADLANTGAQVNSVSILTQNIDLPNILAGTTVDVAVNTTPGTMDAGDVAKFVGAPALEHGLVVQGCHTFGADTFMLRVSNVTAGAIDAVAHAFTFMLYRRA